MKRDIFITILLLAIIGLSMGTLRAQTWNIGTPNAADVTATLSGGTLTISGTGAMQSWTSSTNAPWYSVRTNITTVTINSGVTSIGELAFYDCDNLTSVTIPNSVTSIGELAFYDCSGLTSVTIPASVASIGDLTFTGCCGLTSVTIPNSVITIGNSAFWGCNGLTSIAIPNSVTSIGTYAFYGCSGLTSVTIPDSVTSIGWRAFAFCNGLTSVTIPNSVTSIGDDAFMYCSGLTSVNFNATNCTTMGSSSYPVFRDCTAFATLNIGSNVQTIPSYAFGDCLGLTSLIIPNSVASIGNEAFQGCSGLKSIDVKATTPPTVDYDTFYGVSKDIPLHVPCGQLNAYQTAQYWSTFTNIIDDVDPENLTVLSTDNTMGTASITQMNTCTNNQAIIAATPNAGYRFVKWNDGNTTNPRTITVTRDTTFTAEFTSEVGIAETQALSSVRIYPNPVSDYLIIDNGDLTLKAVEIMDLAGKTVFRFVSISNNSVNVSRLPSGVYFVKIETIKEIVTKKFVKK